MNTGLVLAGTDEAAQVEQWALAEGAPADSLAAFRNVTAVPRTLNDWARQLLRRCVFKIIPVEVSLLRVPTWLV